MAQTLNKNTAYHLATSITLYREPDTVQHTEHLNIVPGSIIILFWGKVLKTFYFLETAQCTASRLIKHMIREGTYSFCDQRQKDNSVPINLVSNLSIFSSLIKDLTQSASSSTRSLVCNLIDRLTTLFYLFQVFPFPIASFCTDVWNLFLL